ATAIGHSSGAAEAGGWRRAGRAEASGRERGRLPETLASLARRFGRARPEGRRVSVAEARSAVAAATGRGAVGAGARREVVAGAASREGAPGAGQSARYRCAIGGPQWRPTASGAGQTGGGKVT